MIKSIHGMTFKKFEKFILTGKVSGIHFSSNQFIEYYIEFLSQTLTSTIILDNIQIGVEIPAIGLKDIYTNYKNVISKKIKDVSTNGFVFVEIKKDFVVEQKRFALQSDAIDYAKSKIKNGFFAEIIDYRFDKEIRKIIKLWKNLFLIELKSTKILGNIFLIPNIQLL